jgi:hypothetical protein
MPALAAAKLSSTARAARIPWVAPLRLANPFGAQDVLVFRPGSQEQKRLRGEVLEIATEPNEVLELRAAP